MTTPGDLVDPNVNSPWGGQQLCFWINTYEIYHLYRQRILSTLSNNSYITNYVLLLLADDFFDYVLFCLSTIAEGPIHPMYYQSELNYQIFCPEFQADMMELIYESVLDMDLDRYYAAGIQSQIENITLYTVYLMGNLFHQIEYSIQVFSPAIRSFFSFEITRMKNMYDVKVTIHYPNDEDERVVHH